MATYIEGYSPDPEWNEKGELNLAFPANLQPTIEQAMQGGEELLIETEDDGVFVIGLGGVLSKGKIGDASASLRRFGRIDLSTLTWGDSTVQYRNMQYSPVSQAVNLSIRVDEGENAAIFGIGAPPIRRVARLGKPSS